MEALALSFNRLGKLGRAVKNVNSFQTTLETTLIDSVQGITAQYAGEPDLQAEIGSQWISLLSGLEGSTSVLQGLAQDTINRMVYRDNPRLNQTLTSSNTAASITEILRQMNLAGATVLQMTMGATPAPFSGIGNGVVVASVKRPFDGRFLENAFAEVIQFTCSADSYTGGATAFNEQFSVTGQGQETDVFAFDWPLGSNGQLTLNAVDGDTNNGSNNLLTNSGFTTFANTPNVPDNWSLTVGTAGTNTQQSQSIFFSNGSALQIIGDGAGTLTSLQQAFNSSAGTPAALSPQNQYSFNIWLRSGGTAITQGVLQVDLIDGNSNIINDCAGNPNSFTFNLTTLTTAWVPFSGFIRTPENMPGTYSIRVHLTTSLPNAGQTFYMDKASLGLMQQLYVQGPFLNLHSGSIPFVQSPVADYATCQITNSRGAGGTLSTWQTLLYQLLTYGQANEIIWPSSLTPTILDSLIS